MLKCSHIQFQYMFFPVCRLAMILFPVRSCQLSGTLVVVHWFTTTWYTPQEDSGAEHFMKQNMNPVLSHTFPCWLGIVWWTQALKLLSFNTVLEFRWKIRNCQSQVSSAEILFGTFNPETQQNLLYDQCIKHSAVIRPPATWVTQQPPKTNHYIL